MNIRTLVIVGITVLVIAFLLDKTYERIDQVCYSDDELEEVVILKGLFSKKKIHLRPSEKKDKYELLKNESYWDLFSNGKKVKTFKPLSSYESNDIF
jgi:hypothetical protein